MRTRKPFSMISYNSVPFLTYKLNQLIDAKIIEEYRFIHHQGEDGDKDHIHLWVKPNKLVDTMELAEQVKEIDTKNDKPLTCVGARVSDEYNFILYVIHDEEYLREHFSDNDGDGKIPYSYSDIIASDYDLLKRAYTKAIQLKNNKWTNVKNDIDKHLDMTTIISRYNLNPIQLSSFVKIIEDEKLKKQCEINVQTGEINK